MRKIGVLVDEIFQEKRDIGLAYQAMKNLVQIRGLEKMLYDLGIQFKNLHNGENDADLNNRDILKIGSMIYPVRPMTLLWQSLKVWNVE